MKKEEIIRVFFEHQSIENQIRIIKDFNISIDGFRTDKLSINTYSLVQSKVLRDITNTVNLKAIQLTVRGLMNVDGNNYDHFLSAEKIVEKYEGDFKGLLLTASLDNFQQKSTNIASLLLHKSGKEMGLNNHNKNQPLSTFEESSEKIVELRDIITKLENNNKSKDNAIQKHIIEKQKLEKLLSIKKENIKKYSKEIAGLKNDIDSLKESLIEKNNKLKIVKDLNESLKSEIQKMKQDSIKEIHIIGIPDGLRESNNDYIFYYNDNEIENFINNQNTSSDHHYFFYPPGLSYYNLRKLINSKNIKRISDKYEYTMIIKEVSIL